MDRLKTIAMDYTLHLLERHSNRPNQLHSDAIRQIIDGIASQLDGNKARKAYPLACGLGKTTCVRGLLFAIHNLNLDYSVVISAGQVEALCNLKNDLISDGIPEELIGLLHSKQYSPEQEPNETYASLPSNTEIEIENRPFVLVTHNKIKHPKTWIDTYLSYKENRRDLVIWDESLLSGQATTLSVLNIVNSIDSAINGFTYRANNDEYKEIIGFLGTLNQILGEFREENDVAIDLPDLPCNLGKANQQIDSLVTNNDPRDLKSLLECLFVGAGIKLTNRTG